MNMNFKRALVGCLLIGACGSFGFCQSPIVVKMGKILYERKINSYNLMDRMSEAGGITKEKSEAYKSNNPALCISHFVLQFKGNSTVYQPDKNGVSAPVSTDEWFNMVANDDVVFTDLNKGHTIIQKNIFGNSFVIEDSLRKIKWKITSEIRNIAGFECRRANALILDSIYIVAFYTNEILPAGGPESFAGLPGMILGLALPYEHISWFAQKVYAEQTADAIWPAPLNKSAIDYRKFTDQLINMTKGWGNAGPSIIRKALL